MNHTMKRHLCNVLLAAFACIFFKKCHKGNPTSSGGVGVGSGSEPMVADRGFSQIPRMVDSHVLLRKAVNA